MTSTGDEARRDSFRDAAKKGEILKISTLAKGERIVIDHIIERDEAGLEGHTYIIEGGSDKVMVSIDRTVAWKKDWGAVLAGDGASKAYTLDKQQQHGLEVFLRYLAAPKAFFDWRYPKTYELTYFRDGREIGSEKFLDVFNLRIPDKKMPYADIEPFYKSLFSPDEWLIVVTFQDLVSILKTESDEVTKNR